MKRLLLLSALGLFAGCDTLDGPQVCTREYVTYTVRVVDASGDLLADLTTRSVVEPSGVELVTAQDANTGQVGVYPVASDAHGRLISRSGTTVRFEATGDGLSAEASFVFDTDGCHVRKVSGPQEIVAR